MAARPKRNPGSDHAPVLVSKPLHGRFKGWAREKGLKLGWATEKAIERFMAESTGGAR